MNYPLWKRQQKRYFRMLAFFPNALKGTFLSLKKKLMWPVKLIIKSSSLEAPMDHPLNWMAFCGLCLTMNCRDVSCFSLLVFTCYYLCTLWYPSRPYTNKQKEVLLKAHWPKVPDNQFTELHPCQLALTKNVMIQQFNGSWVWQRSPSKPLLGNKMIQAGDSGRFSNCLLLAQTQKQSRPWWTTEPTLEYFDS